MSFKTIVLGSLAALCVLIAPLASAQSASSSSSNGAVTVSVTDGKTTIKAGDSLIYAITVKAVGAQSQTVDIDFTLPSYVNTVSPDQGGVRLGNVVTWKNINVYPGQSITYTVQVSLLPSIPQGTVLTASALVAGVKATDTTSIGTAGVEQSLYKVTLTDGKSTVKPGESITYKATVTNLTPDTRTTDVRLSLGTFLVLDDADPSASVNGSVLTWTNVDFGPSATKTFTVAADILRAAPDYYLLSSQLRAGDASATDTTSVLANSATSSKKSSSSSSKKSSSSSAKSGTTANAAVRFSVTPDTTEVIAGGRIRYTVSVKNTSSETIDEATVTVRVDPSTAVIIDEGNGVRSGSSIVFALKDVDENETWKGSFVLAAGDLPNGSTVSVVSTIEGDGIRNQTIDSRTAVGSVAVIAELPTTGSDAVTLVALLLVVLAAVLAVIHGSFVARR